MTNANTILDYDKLVAAYNTNLDVTLRGFRPAEEMLDTWVPDEDLLRSLSSLVEAAQLCGTDDVQVRIGRETLGTQSLPALREKIASFGDLQIQEEADAVLLSVTSLQQAASFRAVRPAYQQKLRSRSSKLAFQREIKIAEGQTTLQATDEGCSLAWAVDNSTHIIKDAAFGGTTKRPIAALLDVLCDLVVGLPIQEARDHAVVRLEFALRDPQQKAPVQGVLLPQNADPIFRLPGRLVNRLFEDYVTSTGYRPGMNFFDPGPGEAWVALSPEERKLCVEKAIQEHSAPLGLKPGEVEIVDCNHAFAATIRFQQEVPISRKRSMALALERLVRRHCDPRLEVFCEEKKDLSKLRRLTETK